MVDQLAQLDAEIAFLDQVAAELERQVGPSPVTRTLVIAWLTEWVKQSGGLKPIYLTFLSLSQRLTPPGLIKPWIADKKLLPTASSSLFKQAVATAGFAR